MPNFPEKLARKIKERVSENALRILDLQEGLIDFSSNDYLGFSRNPNLTQKAIELLKDLGQVDNGATGSRLLTGNHELYTRLENNLAKFHKTETALVFNSGYDANLGFFSSVPLRNDIVLYDELCHASIRDGIKLGLAKSYNFKHNDLQDLQNKIKKVGGEAKGDKKEIYVVTESVFSMDGDSPDLKELVGFCSKNKLHLVVDEAHALGVFGKGLINELELEGSVFARILTFGKSIGCHGAAILGSKELKTYLINFARSLIYTTALSPHSIALVMCAYQELESDIGLSAISQLRTNINFFKECIYKNGLNSHFIQSDSAIQICRIGGNTKTKNLSELFKNEGFDVRAILAPTVPEGAERLRFCLHAFNTEDEMKRVLQTIKTSI